MLGMGKYQDFIAISLDLVYQNQNGSERFKNKFPHLFIV
jgi:hypothetical protein